MRTQIRACDYFLIGNEKGTWAGMKWMSFKSQIHVCQKRTAFAFLFASATCPFCNLIKQMSQYKSRWLSRRTANGHCKSKWQRKRDTIQAPVPQFLFFFFCKHVQLVYSGQTPLKSDMPFHLRRENRKIMSKDSKIKWNHNVTCYKVHILKRK